jgi:hypothetical protein
MKSPALLGYLQACRSAGSFSWFVEVGFEYLPSTTRNMNCGPPRPRAWRTGCAGLHQPAAVLGLLQRFASWRYLLPVIDQRHVGYVSSREHLLELALPVNLRTATGEEHHPGMSTGQLVPRHLTGRGSG